MAHFLMVLSIFSLAVAQQPCKAYPSKEIFDEGRRIIEWSVGDSVGGSREKLEQGMAKIREALDRGYEGNMEAYHLMIDAQRSIAVIYAEEGSEDKKQSLDFLKTLYEEALEFDPDNVKLLFDSAELAPWGKSREEILRRILEIDPGFSAAKFALGQTLFLEGKDKVTGEAMMREVYAESSGPEKYFRGQRLSDCLRRAGRDDEAREIFEEIKDLPVE